MKIGLTFTGEVLVPLEPEDFERLRESFGPGEIVAIDVKLARNLKHHNLHHARFAEIVKRGSVIRGKRFFNKDALRSYVYCCVGWCEEYRDVNDGRVFVARSINFDAADQTLFSRIDHNIVLFLAEELDPPIDSITAEADDLIARGVERTSLKDAR